MYPVVFGRTRAPGHTLSLPYGQRGNQLKRLAITTLNSQNFVWTIVEPLSTLGHHVCTSRTNSITYESMSCASSGLGTYQGDRDCEDAVTLHQKHVKSTYFSKQLMHDYTLKEHLKDCGLMVGR